MKRGIRALTSKQRGDQLELRVASMFKKMLKLNVQRHQILRDHHGNISEIDVTYGYFFKKYIECKNFTGPVPLEYVAKFNEVLKLNRIPPSKGIFITTSYYTPRATTIGIKTIDGEQLKSLEKRAVYYGAMRLIGISLVGLGIVSVIVIQSTQQGGLSQALRDTWKTAGRRYPSVASKVDGGIQGIKEWWNDVKWKIP